MAGVRSDIKFVKGAWKVHLGHPTRKDDIGWNIQVIFQPSAMFGGEPSKHNDEIKVKVSKLWKLFTATKTTNTRLRRTWVFDFEVSLRELHVPGRRLQNWGHRIITFRFREYSLRYQRRRYLSQWTLRAYIQIYHKKKGSKPYAEHTSLSIKMKFPSLRHY